MRDIVCRMLNRGSFSQFIMIMMITRCLETQPKLSLFCNTVPQKTGQGTSLASMTRCYMELVTKYQSLHVLTPNTTAYCFFFALVLLNPTP
jgi:hypothetical protein